MINPVSSASLSKVSPAQNVKPAAVRQQTSPSQPKAQPQPTPTATDTVQVSSLAKAALQEAIENPAQTAREANAGDLQAKRLLAKEAADRAL